MVNTEEFTNRINKVMEYYDLSAASFADKIDVGRSSISHLLSGRNKPSLDFVMKIVKAFPEVELYWLLNGKGSFPKSATTSSTEATKTQDKAPEESVDVAAQIKEDRKIPFSNTHKEIKKIVVLYSDGTFEAYEP